MPGTVSNQSTLTLDGTKSGVISIAKISEPYGEGSASVASIGISLAGDSESPEWKVHIPMNNLDDVIKALEKIKG
jgi:hypothetical protein